MNHQTLTPPRDMRGLDKVETYRYYEGGTLRQTTVYVLVDAVTAPDEITPHLGQGDPNGN